MKLKKPKEYEYPITRVLDNLSEHKTPRIYGAGTTRLLSDAQRDGHTQGGNPRPKPVSSKSTQKTVCGEPPAFSSLHPIARALRGSGERD